MLLASTALCNECQLLSRLPEVTMTTILRTCVVLALTCAAVSLADAQSADAESGVLKFAIVKSPHIVKEMLDSLVMVRPARRSVDVIIAFNNACGIQPKGRYRMTGDTIVLRLDYQPHFSETAFCPADSRPEQYLAAIHLKPGQYAVQVQFAKQAHLWRGPDLWRRVDVK
jgi:hypothetical protein